MTTGKRGISFLEVIVAITILLLSILTIFQALSTTREHTIRADLLMTSRLLAQSIMEQAVERFLTEDNRHFKLGTPPDRIAASIASGAWKNPFLALAQPRTPVLTPRARLNPYFTPDTGPILPDATLARPGDNLWGSLSYEVRVSFEVTPTEGKAPVPIDANGDGRAETDVAQLEVEIFQETRAGGPESVIRMVTLLTVPDKLPGVGALSGAVGL